ncbi:MAG: PEP-CTERM sorting domain-containing protein [Chthonomonas sp.]|nr:PEP-CTERM sorting domain-containing protein [Chthonomonas sp.]
MLKHALALGCLAALPLVSSASYEMGLVMQGLKVHRWDPVSNTYLGNFNLLASGTSIISYQSTGESYVLSGSWVYKYDYNSGEYRGRVDVGAGAGSISKGMNDGEFLIGYSGNVLRRSVATGAAIGTPLAWAGGGFSYLEGAAAMRSTGVYYLLAERTTYFEDYDYLIGVNSSSTWVGNFRNAGIWGGTNSGIRGGDVSGNLVGFLTTISGSNQFSTEYARRNASDTLDYAFDNLSIGASRPSYMLFGHNESAVRLLGSNSGYFFTRTSFDGGFGATQTLLSWIDPAADVNGFSMIVAPEPGSLAAIGLGALLLLRKRK